MSRSTLSTRGLVAAPQASLLGWFMLPARVCQGFKFLIRLISNSSFGERGGGVANSSKEYSERSKLTIN